MFRVGAFVLIALVLSLSLGCNEKTSEAQETGLELGFMNCITFNAWVFIDGQSAENLKGSYSSERAWFIDVAAGNHTLYVESNLVVSAGNTKFCWTENFSVADGQVTYLTMDCDSTVCPASE